MELAVKPGDILRDKYRIDALIGRGGMGHVFAATALDSSVRTQVAIKVVSRLLVDDTLMVRLHREAEAAQRIQSDYVPRVLEVNDTEDGETFLVMERLVGEPLSQRIRDNGALPWSEVSRIGQDVLRGIIDAHTAGIVHRDLKPSNVFLALKSGRLRAMVLDFGVCKMDGLDTERLTGTGESIGTVAYMAPEQIRGAARVDERADLFAFGVLVFEMLSGRLPHDGPSQMAILASKLENPAARLRDCTRVTIPEALDELVARTLERDPKDRFANAQDLMKAWRALSTQNDQMMAATSSQPPRAASSEDDVTVGGDAPTEISRPAGMVPSSTSTSTLSAPSFLSDTTNEDLDEDDDVLDEAHARGGVFLPASSRLASFPPEPHPTQTSLTTQAGGIRRTGGGRIALLLAACGLIAGVVIVGVSFTRAPPPAPANASQTSASGSGDPSETPHTPSPPEGAVEIATSTTSSSPAPDDSASSFELPADTTNPAQPAGRPKPRVRATPRGPAAQPKSSGPRITSQPRY